MSKIAAFRLNSVIRFPESIWVELLAKVWENHQTPDRQYPTEKSLDQQLDWLEDKLESEELEALKKDFKKQVKKAFVKDEDLFEVRPGVQALFGQMEKHDDWTYAIISPLWEESTRFILQSCGIFSKDKLNINREDGRDLEEQLKHLKKQFELKAGSFVYLVSLEEPKELISKLKVVHAGPRASSKDQNYYTYPPLKDFLGKKKRKKLKKRNLIWT